VQAVTDEQMTKRRRENLLKGLNLPSKRPFSKMHMSDNEKKIHTMIQRLTMLGRQKEKEKKEHKEKY